MQTITTNSIDFLKAVVDQASETFIICDDTGVVVLWSTKAERLFGWTCQEAVGKNISSLIMPSEMKDIHAQRMANFSKTRHSPIIGKKLHLPAIGKAGKVIPIEIIIDPFEVNGSLYLCARIFDYVQALLTSRSIERIGNENSLKSAIDRGELELLYQPRLNSVTKRLSAVEALLRWNHPTRGLVSPTEFIPIAEETGLIGEIGDWVMHQACMQMRKWRASGLRPFRVSVNVSPKQLGTHHVKQAFADIIKDTNVPANCIELEVTESAIMENIDVANEVLSALKYHGMRIAVDDFGTGYSSLSIIKKLPITCLKIDRSFVTELDVDADYAAIVKATIAMAKSLNLKVVAEGVCRIEQVRFLAEHHCDELQGFLFSRAVTANVIESGLRNGIW